MAQINAMAQLQQQQLQQQLIAQQLLAAQQQAAAAGANAAQASKKQREVYVGNLTIGIVNDVMLRELFNGALASLVPDPQTNPPVVNCQLDPTGRFGFVELRSEELATSAMSLDKVELCGRSINVGRPKGYVEPINGHARPAPVWMPGMPVPGAPAQAQAPVSAPMLPGLPAAAAGPVPTCVLLLENLVPVKDLRDPAERQDLCDDVKEECNKDGRVVLGITCPVPPDATLDSAGGRVYVKFGAPEQAKSAYALMNGRQFDGNKVTAKYLSDEQFTLAEAGSWMDHSQPAHSAAPATSLPGPPTLPGGGLPGPPPMPAGSAAMHPAIAALAKTNPALAAQMMGHLPQ
eukprot:CAMPEP_0177779310 /NCGR_PEP_ID=MMETSP0491_2-20121128/16507_1 /TAXON_ID=63592 /ORGANISM="Tetraselmis chuii, Strain PLY429" /LENGTH=346 /DNA_ID=CAMNT_0019298817 /DNA_START=897 /DNA_END=1937 /DNA_ORIENTATION=+